MSEQQFEIKYGTIWRVKYVNRDRIEEELWNPQIVRILNEQQDTIRKLQDFVGQSDGENAKLRIENKRLCDELKLLKPTNLEQYEQIVQLQEENEQLRQQLKTICNTCCYDCEEKWCEK